MSADTYAVIMAGGVGSRFWPESREDNPKQFLDLTGSGKSLLRQTYERINRLFPASRILVVTNRKYADKVKEHLPELPADNILQEPAMRNTAPAILYAANKIRRRNPKAVFAVLPSDHFIADEEKFLKTLGEALEYARRNKSLITLGIRPTRPHTGYGYIRHEPNDPEKFKRVLQFVEKPAREKAEKYLQEGNYLWNAGMFVWPVESIREAYRRHLPVMFEEMEKIPYDTKEEQAALEKIFPRLQNISVDYGILEKAEDIKVLPAEFGWNDLGSWDALYEQLKHRDQANLSLNSRLIADNATGNLVKTPGKTVILSGLENYIIVDTGDVLMIVPRDKAQDVKLFREKALKTSDS